MTDGAGVCGACRAPIRGDSRFCLACAAYLPDPALGTRAGLFGRWVAAALDGVITLLTLTVALWIGFARGTTPGHAIMRHRIVRTDGEPVGFGTMVLRDLVGKTVSGAFLGLGYFWAIWDKDAQAWHDKIAGTVVLRRRRAAAR